MIMLVSGFINGLRKVMNGTDTEWQQRTELLLGEDKMLRLRNSHVLVVGLGLSLIHISEPTRRS